VEDVTLATSKAIAQCTATPGIRGLVLGQQSAGHVDALHFGGIPSASGRDLHTRHGINFEARRCELFLEIALIEMEYVALAIGTLIAQGATTINAMRPDLREDDPRDVGVVLYRTVACARRLRLIVLVKAWTLSATGTRLKNVEANRGAPSIADFLNVVPEKSRTALELNLLTLIIVEDF